VSVAAGSDDFNQYAVLAEAIRERDAARAEVLRQRALLDDLRCCPVERSTMSHVTLWIGRSTWDALHAIDARTEQVPL
jgi:hypothetical protein